MALAREGDREARRDVVALEAVAIDAGEFEEAARRDGDALEVEPVGVARLLGRLVDGDGHRRRDRRDLGVGRIDLGLQRIEARLRRGELRAGGRRVRRRIDASAKRRDLLAERADFGEQLGIRRDDDRLGHDVLLVVLGRCGGSGGHQRANRDACAQRQFQMLHRNPLLFRRDDGPCLVRLHDSLMTG